MQTDTKTNSANTPLENNQADFSSRRSGPSRLFYIIFGLTLFVFLGLLFAVFVNFLANNSLQEKKPNSATQNQYKPTAHLSPTKKATDSATVNLLTQSDSDEVGDIDRDLKDTDLDSLDKESSSIEAMMP